MSSQTTMMNGSQSSMTYDRNTNLKAFDESKIGVKGEVDAGAEKIPSIFVRPHEDLSKEFDTCDKSVAVPIIDLAHVGQRDSQGAVIIRRILWASEKWGFFQLVNHGIPLQVLDKVIEGVRMFHEQDVEAKKKFYSRDGSRQVRFNTNFDLYQSKAANWRDTLYISTVFEAQLDREALPPICRDAILSYLNHVIKLGELLLELLSMGLGLEPDYLRETECSKAWNLSGHYYPACPEPDLTFGASKHSDPSFLTILLQDHIGGLQVLHQDQWVNVEPVPGALIVNIGDILQMISNDKLKSVYHRVIANRVGPRISIATFFTGFVFSPKIHGPIKELVSVENPPLYREFTIQEFLTKFLSRALDQPGFENFRQPVSKIKKLSNWVGGRKRKMKNFAGTPGTVTGLLLRITQFMFAAGSIASMATTSSFFNFTALCYLIASMGLQVIWSLGLALLDAYALATKRVLHNPILVSLFVIGDWVTATLSLAAASACAGITVLYFHDLGGCTLKMECQKYELSVAFAFLSWLTVFISSLIMFWLLAAG